jgi:hypothetical protein
MFEELPLSNVVSVIVPRGPFATSVVASETLRLIELAGVIVGNPTIGLTLRGSMKRVPDSGATPALSERSWMISTKPALTAS